jgi:hypothetical protein
MSPQTRFLIPSIMLSIALLTGCAKVHMRLSAVDSSVALVVRKGHTINWTDMIARFKLVSPCRQGLQTSTCKVNVDYGRYRYDCHTCEDPEIIVESVSRKFQYHSTGGGAGPEAARTTTRNEVVDYACVSGRVELAPTSRTVAKTKSVVWAQVGGDQHAVAKWMVAFDGGNSPCDQGAINQDQRKCTVKSAAAAGKYPYTFSTDGKCGKREGEIVVP